MNKSQQKKIKTLYQIGTPVQEIAEIFKITPNKVAKICKKTKRL